MRSRPRRRLLVVAAGVLLVSVSLLLPRTLGGPATYVVTNGISMRPSIEAGDLVVTRAAPGYDVGDVVAFHSDLVSTTVLHRVVERDGDRLVTKGDNNSWLDPELPTEEEVMGRLWLHVPGGGKIFAWLSTPLHAFGVAASASVLTGLGTVRRRGRKDGLAPRSKTRRAMGPQAATSMRTVGSWLGLAGAALLALGAFAATRPATEVVEEDVAFTQHTSFAYSTAPAPPLYPDGIGTGEPVFLQLAQRVSVELTHRVESEAAADLDGTVAVDVVLTGTGGWQRAITLLPPRPLDDGETTSAVTLDLPALQALAEETAALTASPLGTLSIAVSPTFELAGTVADQPVEDTFTPVLAFTLDAVALRPEGASTPDGGDGPSLTESQAGTVAVPISVPATLALPLPGPDPTVATARTFGLAGGLGLLLLAGILALVGRRHRGDEPAQIAARHGDLLVPIEGAGGSKQGAMIDVSTFDALARLAAHHERLVLHHVAGDEHTYLVELQGTAYRYRPRASGTGTRGAVPAVEPSAPASGSPGS